MRRLSPGKTGGLWYLVPLLLAVAVLSPFAAGAVPPVPHQIFGDAQIDTGTGLLDVPEGALVRVELPSGQEIASGAAASGQYGFSPLFFIPGDDPESLAETEGAKCTTAKQFGPERDCDVVRVLLDQYLVTTLHWESGANTRLDLEIPEANVLELTASFTVSVGGTDVSVTSQSPRAGVDTVKASGVVTNRATGNPVSSATVVVRWGDGQSGTTTTGTNGAFQVTHIYPLAGAYTATATAQKADFLGASVSQGIEVSAVAEDTDAPSTPTGLQASAGNGQVTLTWSANSESDLAGYRIYRRTGATVRTRIAEVLVNLDQGIHPTSHVDATVSNGVTYFYDITAVDSSGNESDPTAEVQARPSAPVTGVGPTDGGAAADTTPPPTPSNFTATPGDGQVTLSWTLNETDTLTYFISRSTTSGGPYTLAGSVNQGTNTLVDTNVENGVTYYYVIFAQDEAGNTSELSAEVFATPGLDTVPPAAPTGLVAQAGDGEVTLSWNANTEEDLAGYHVFRSQTAGGPYAQVTGTLLSGPAYVDTGLENGVAYYYVVRALDLAGNSSGDSNEASATPRDLKPPARPTGVSALPGDRKIELSWNANLETDLAGYHVFQSTTQGGPYTQITTALVTATTYTVGGLSNGVRYYFLIAAIDVDGRRSPLSSEVSGVPADVTPPAAPTGLTAEAGDGQVSLTWTANPEPDVVGYHIFRSLVSGVTGTRITPSPIVGASYVDRTVVNGETYYYVIRAVDSSANTSTSSAEVSATPEAGAVIITPTPTVSPTATPEMPVEVTRVAVSPAEVDAGVPVTVTVRVSNPAAQEQAYNLPVLVNGEAVDRAVGTLTPGGARQHVFTVSRSAPGIYTVEVGGARGQFVVRGAELVLREAELRPHTVAPGDEVRLTGRIFNLGGAPGAYVAELSVGGDVEASIEGLVLVGKQVSLRFDFSRDEPGEYEVSLSGSLSFVGSFVVSAPAMDVTLPTSVTISAETASATDESGNAVQVTAGAVQTEGTPEGTMRISLPVSLSAGARLGAFNDTTSGIKVEGNTVTIPVKDDEGNDALFLVAETEGLVGTGTAAQATVTKLSLATPERDVDLSGDDPDVGTIGFSVGAELKRLPEGARLTITPKKTLSKEDASGFELVATGQGETIADIGVAIQIDKLNLANESVVGQATVRIAVNQRWVDKYGEGNVRISRLGDDGMREFLTTQRVGTDAQGRVLFEAVSPRGFSIFALMAVAPRSADIFVTSMTVDPAVVVPQGVVTVSASVANSGNAAGTSSVVLAVNNAPVEVKGVSLAAGESKEVVFLLRLVEAGRYEVTVGDFTETIEVTNALSAADVLLTDLRVAPSTVSRGTPVEVSVRVQNTSQRAGKFDVVLAVNDVISEIQPVSLTGGQAKRVSFTVVRQEAGGYKVTISSMVDAFTVRRELSPASFVPSGLTVSKERVKVAEEVTVQAFVENTGDQAGTFEARLLVNGQEREVKTLELLGQERVLVTFTVTFDEAGTYTIELGPLQASIEVEALEAPALAKLALRELVSAKTEVRQGEGFTVSVVAANAGNAAGSFDIVLQVDGQTVDSRSVDLAPGAEQEVSFTVQLEEVGRHILQVGDLTVEVMVTEVVEERLEEEAAPGNLLWTIIVLLILVAAATGVAILLDRNQLQPPSPA